MSISLKNVSYSYKGKYQTVRAVDGVSYDFEPGKCYAIIGKSGSGKTTLVNLIPRFYDACSGCVSVGGIPVKEWSSVALRERIGIVPQKASLFRGTIRENLLWGRSDATDEELYAALRVAQAEDIVKGKEGALDAPVEQHGRNFSGGQRQRLTIARAIVQNPDILILDDSASALDYATDLALRRAIAAMDPAPTTVIVSQRAASIHHADRILVLDDGELVAQSTHETLLESFEVYQEIYYSQFPEEEA
jgi:ABC-type multidrug transport system fused ATPase/permease subunit